MLCFVGVSGGAQEASDVHPMYPEKSKNGLTSELDVHFCFSRDTPL